MLRLTWLFYSLPKNILSIPDIYTNMFNEWVLKLSIEVSRIFWATIFETDFMLKDQNTYFNNQQMFRREKKSLLYSKDVRSFNHLKRFIIGL